MSIVVRVYDAFIWHWDADPVIDERRYNHRWGALLHFGVSAGGRSVAAAGESLLRIGILASAGTEDDTFPFLQTQMTMSAETEP